MPGLKKKKICKGKNSLPFFGWLWYIFGGEKELHDLFSWIEDKNDLAFWRTRKPRGCLQRPSA